VTIRPPPGVRGCGTTFTRTGRRIWCSDTCKQAAWRRRHAAPAAPPRLPPARHRREITIYQCDQCGERQPAGEQWCPDCSQPCRRAGYGGPCPSCGDPVTITDLIGDSDITVSISKP
jgi:hypothetical protein